MLYKCIANEDYVNIKLTIGKVYENLLDPGTVEVDDVSYLYIKDDMGLSYYVDMVDFILLDDFREELLNKIGI
jgi:hypothetical protein